MAILKNHKHAVINEHVEAETGYYITVKKWLTRIYKVVDIDTNEVYTIDSDCKLVYAYLFNFGKCHGWDNIYPNQSLIAEELGMHIRTLQRKIKVLGKSGLIDVIKTKDAKTNNFYSNKYRVKRPPSIGRRKWFDINGVELSGKLYKFDYSLFKKAV